MEEVIDKIYEYFKDTPKSHQEWAASFGIKGDIKRILNREKPLWKSS